MKKVLVLMFLLVGFLFVTQINAEAKVLSIEEAEAIAAKANEKIEKEIEKAILEAESLKRDHRYEVKLDKIINKLVLKTNKIAQKAIRDIEKLGFTAECEYQDVIIGNRVVKIDPIRVHRW